MPSSTPIDHIAQLRRRLQRAYRSGEHPEEIPWFPLKKFRGQRRYFQELARTAAQLTLDLSNDSWYDLWHWHPDMAGYSNLNYRFLRAHLQHLFQAYSQILAQATNVPREYQTWIYLNSGDFSRNALYFHMPQAPQKNFPIRISGAKPVNRLPDYLLNFLEDTPYQCITTAPGGTREFFIFAPGRGLSLYPASPG